MLLPDVNIWLALAFQSHVHHATAKAWFAGPSAPRCVFCRATQQGFFRRATNPKVFCRDAVTMSHACRLYDAFLADPRVSFSGEPPGVEPFWRAYTQRQTFSPKVWNDVYLAAPARVADYELDTFGRGFGHYAGLKCAILHWSDETGEFGRSPQ